MVAVVMMVIIVIKVTPVYFKNVRSFQCKAVDMECLVCVQRAVVWGMMSGDLLRPLSGQRLDKAGFSEMSDYIYQIACRHIPRDSGLLSNKSVLNTVLLFL